jgi:hypothetical protein
VNERLELVLRAIAKEKLSGEDADIVEKTADSVERVGRGTLADAAKGVFRKLGESSA